MPTNHLWNLIQKYMDDPRHRYPPKPADLARETGVSEQVLSKWKAKPVLPNPRHLLAFSAGTGIPYADLLRAALQGQLYLPPTASGSRIEFSRSFLRLLESQGPSLVESLKAATNAQQKPGDLSDIFGPEAVSDPGARLRSVASEGELEDPGEDSI